jgi:glycosyltransferase involved in cell wall biosynthesis
MPQGATPALSVIVPVHRTRPQFVRECLASVAAQRGAPSWEIILVDDASGEAYVEGLAETADRYGATLLRLPEHRGPTAARNEGARAARGDHLLFLDSDDLLSDGMLAALAPALVARARLVYTNVAVVSADASRTLHVRDKRVWAGLLERFAGTEHDPLIHSTFINKCEVYRRDVFLELGGYGTAIGLGEECDLAIRLEERFGADALWLAAGALYLYRDNPESLVHQRDALEEVRRTRDRILVEAARRRGLDVVSARRLGRAMPTHTPVYELVRQNGERLGAPYLDYESLALRPDGPGASS